MEVTSKVVESYQGKIRLGCRIISYVLLILFFITALDLAAPFSQGFSLFFDSPLSCSGALAYFSKCLLAGAMLTSCNLFRSAAQSDSLFTEGQSRRMLAISVLISLSCAIDLVSQGMLAFFVSHGFIEGVRLTNAGIHVDAPSLVCAVICFGLSMLFRYAALLQSVSDETV